MNYIMKYTKTIQSAKKIKDEQDVSDDNFFKCHQFWPGINNMIKYQ